MAHLAKRPTYFVKGNERRAAYYTINARELREAGYTEEGEKAVIAPRAKPVPEIIVEAGQDAFDDDSVKVTNNETLEEMTKAELLDYALEHGHDLRNSLPKSEVYEFCKNIEASL